MAVLLKSKDGHGWTTSVAFKWLPKKGRPNLDQKQIRPDVFEKTGSKVGKSVSYSRSGIFSLVRRDKSEAKKPPSKTFLVTVIVQSRRSCATRALAALKLV